MGLKTFLFDEDRGVSPVIGVILMVAITVILAAVIATFVMNMGPSEASPANANWEFSNQSSHILIEHGGGGAAPASEYVLQVDFDTGSEEVPLTVSDSTGSSPYAEGYDSGAELTATDTFKLYNASGTYSTTPSPGSGYTGNYWEMPDTSGGSGAANTTATVDSVTLLWENPNNDQTQVIEEWSP